MPTEDIIKVYSISKHVEYNDSNIKTSHLFVYVECNTFTRIECANLYLNIEAQHSAIIVKLSNLYLNIEGTEDKDVKLSNLYVQVEGTIGNLLLSNMYLNIEVKEPDWLYTSSLHLQVDINENSRIEVSNIYLQIESKITLVESNTISFY